MVVFLLGTEPSRFSGEHDCDGGIPLLYATSTVPPHAVLHTPLTHIDMTQHMQVLVLTCATHTCVLWPCIY